MESYLGAGSERRCMLEVACGGALIGCRVPPVISRWTIVAGCGKASDGADTMFSHGGELYAEVLKSKPNCLWRGDIRLRTQWVRLLMTSLTWTCPFI